MEQKFEKFFLGANSCTGFVSEFGSNYRPEDGWRALLIKGGPGTGKSSLMKYVAVREQEAGETVQLCVCSSDPQSLDGVILPKRRIIVLDATAPHVVEPQFPGACEEILNLGKFWSGQKMRKNAEQIRAATLENKALHQSASRYLRACGGLMEDSLTLARRSTDTEKCAAFAHTLCKRLLPPCENPNPAEWVRFLQGVTPLGILSYNGTVTDFYSHRIVISDSFGSVAHTVMQTVRECALAAGYEIITVRNPFLPEELIDHILIPALSLAFVRESEFMHFKCDERRIHARRFLDMKRLHENRRRMLFNTKAARQLLLGASETLAKAKATHDVLEQYYISAMDFPALTAYLHSAEFRTLFAK